MAFNSTLGTRRRAPIRATSQDYASSIFSESQSLWVLFNPTGQLEPDVLSLSTNNPLTTTEEEEEEEEEEDEEEEGNEGGEEEGQQNRQESASGLTKDGQDEYEEDDDLVDDLTLANRINEWQRATETEVSDNMASWDLDADLVEKLLDKSILRHVPDFYGAQYFDHMSQTEFARFKEASAMLKESLTRDGYAKSDSNLFTRLIELLQWQNLLKSQGSLVNDYVVNTLARTNLHKPEFKSVEFSDTATSSSMIMCGGGSWNDL